MILQRNRARYFELLRYTEPCSAIDSSLFNTVWPNGINLAGVLVSVRPEIGKFGRDQGVRKILPQSYG